MDMEFVKRFNTVESTVKDLQRRIKKLEELNCGCSKMPWDKNGPMRKEGT